MSKERMNDITFPFRLLMSKERMNDITFPYTNIIFSVSGLQTEGSNTSKKEKVRLFGHS